ncbi:MAG: molybdopterin molybdotransferase MoeA [Labilithrix sp.]|nr:molybdopterin molybdotransferase MoeA [Labilithrix sp.]MBX3220696.1 molybdopterin molybdotransferase MoeA [Labilithrix sp.]
MLRFEEALARILALGTPTLEVERVAIEDLDGRVLADDLVARADLPGFDYSAMDGYAVRTRDLEGEPPLRLPVRGESRTGAVPDALEAGAAMRIFTGGAVPAGADAVVMQENVTRDGDVAVLTARPRAGQNIRRRGADLAAGATAIVKGTRLRPAHLALAAALDDAEIPVTRRPEVAILATGDELRRPGTDAVPGTIPESNTVVLRAMARRAGARARALPFVRDERAATERAFAAALEESDVVVTIGGVSVGDHDLVRPALEAVGVTLDFWRVAMKPGKPLAVGRFARSGRRDAIVLGLPGNPASAIVTFALFGVPLLRALQGDARPFPARLRARMTRAHVHDPGRLELARATVTHAEDGQLTVTTHGNQASGAVTATAHSDALVFIPAESNGVPAGAEVDVLLLSDLSA